MSAMQQESSQDQNWIQLTFNNLNDPKSQTLKNLLYCTNKENELKVEMTNEQLMTL
jgi:hypothetical protein